MIIDIIVYYLAYVIMSLFKVHNITKKKAVKKIKGDINLRKDVLIRQEIKSQTFLLQKLYEKNRTKSKSTEDSYDTYRLVPILIPPGS